ncbi:hypothetical protein H2203_007929 [Taxawa tesnikishii (nom. ined.)]|nr:hypothetical protein H2203_007929 [Dothideales sp. JES 119]
MATVLTCLAGLGLVSSASAYSLPRAALCDSVQNGYQCQPDISHSWGQYSPFSSVPSEISADVPNSCSVTFAQILSRHGARDPTASKTKSYSQLVAKLHNNVASFTGKYAFIASYNYTLGADNLSAFGAQEMVNSGVKYYDRYESLARNNVPFVRSTSDQRVVDSATNWTSGYTQARSSDRKAQKGIAAPKVDVVLSEDTGMNDTLNHDLCTNFEDGPDSDIASAAQQTWASVFIPPIQSRINADLKGANLSITETVYLMDLCPFNTVANASGAISPFCSLFTQYEWQEYGYYESLNKYYGYGLGNPLGPTQGVGFALELIARLTNTSVVDLASVNATLDANPATFPSADSSIFFALGLYKSTAPLSNTTIESVQQTNGYSAAYTVPFAARAYFEKLKCAGHKEELVRVIVNDRVIPLKTCGADSLGRCKLSGFVESLSFVRQGGDWNQCFT